MSVNSGKDYKHLNKGTIPVFGTGGYMLSVDQSLSEKDSIGIGRKGTINKPQYLKAPFWTVDTLFYLTMKDKHNTLFFYFLAQKIDWLKFDESSGVPSLSKRTIEKIPITVPDYDEQEKIATLLEKLENLTELYQRKLQKLKQLKQGYLQKLFPDQGAKVPELRFEGFTENWEPRKFQNLIKRINNNNSMPDLPRIEYEDVIADSGRLNKNVFSKDSNKKGILFQQNNILFGKLRPYLKKWFIADFEGIAIGDFWVFDTQDNPSLFIYYLIQTSKFQKVANLSTGTKMPRSDWQTVSKSTYFVPDRVEQERIGQLLKQLEKIIQFYQKKSQEIATSKKVLLQKMFI